MVKTRKIKVKSIENEEIIMTMKMTKTIITKIIIIVHERITFFGSSRGTKHNIDFYWPQGVYLLEKYDGLSKSVTFSQSWGILQTRMD